MAGKLASRVKGLSEAQFREAYGTEERCRAAVEKLRWPKGFVCPLCGSCEGKWLGTRPKIQCRACRHQVSLTAGTIFHATKLPLTSWFLAMWLVATAKNGISSVELGRRLGIKQTNAWALKQKVMHVMAERDGKKRLDGRVEMDDAYLGGHRPGKRGRGAAGKQPFVGGGLDQRRPPPAQDEAAAGQGLPQEGGRAARQRAPGLDQPARHRRARLLDGRGRGRPGTHGDGDRERQ